MKKGNRLIYLKGIRWNFSETAYIRYRQMELKHKKYLLIVFGKCNFRCKYCFMGACRSSKGILPKAKLMPLSKIENEIICAMKLKLPVRISGGEPTLYPDETIHLLKIIKEYGGFSIVDTNGSNPNILTEFSKYCNVLSIDGPKDNYEIISQTTGVSLDECSTKPLKSMKIARNFECILEFKTIIFKHTEINHLKFISQNLPPGSYWTLKQYQPEIGHFPNNQNQEIIREKNPHFTPMSKKDIFEKVYELFIQYPHLKNKITVIIGSSRFAENLYQLSSAQKLVRCNELY